MAAAGKACQEGRYSEAERLFIDAIKEVEGFGPGDPRLPASLNSLAELYRTRSKYAEAEALYKRALAIREKTLGPDHPEVATSLNNLAVLYHDERKNAEAEALYKRALTIQEKTLGTDHLEVATSLNNLDRKSTRLNSSHSQISYAVFCLKKKKKKQKTQATRHVQHDKQQQRMDQDAERQCLQHVQYVIIHAHVVKLARVTSYGLI